MKIWHQSLLTIFKIMPPFRVVVLECVLSISVSTLHTMLAYHIDTTWQQNQPISVRIPNLIQLFTAVLLSAWFSIESINLTLSIAPPEHVVVIY